MHFFIWHHIWPDYDERMMRMSLPANVSMAKRAAYDELSLVPMEQSMPEFYLIESDIRRWYIDGEYRTFDWWDMLSNW